jgi:hypothetical protein
MNYKKFLTTLSAASALLYGGLVMATPISDIQDHSNNTATEYFVDVDANKYNNPWYRNSNQDWGWTHGSIIGSAFSLVELEISGFDVDSPHEVDNIEVWDGGGWVGLGPLVGVGDEWRFTTFDLSSYGWIDSEVNNGLQVRMDIDASNGGWVVTLGKSVLSIVGGTVDCDPTPGVPCDPTAAVSEPSILALLGLGVVGLGFARRRRQS